MPIFTPDPTSTGPTVNPNKQLGMASYNPPDLPPGVTELPPGVSELKPQGDLSKLVTGKPTREQALREAIMPTKGWQTLPRQYGIPLVMPFGGAARAGYGAAANLGADTAMAGLYQTAKSALEGSGIKKSLIDGLIGAGSNVAGAALATPAKIAGNFIAARAAETGLKAKQALDKGFADMMNAIQQTGHAETVKQMAKDYAAKLPESMRSGWLQQVSSHGEKAAASIMDSAKKLIPAWQGFGSDVKGLTDAVVGKGQQLLSQDFDKEMAKIVAQGTGTLVNMRGDLAQKLGVSGTEGGIPGMVMVDAGALAQAATGAWKKAPDAYRAAVDTLAKAGLGSEAARKAYMTGQGVIQFIDKTGALAGDLKKGIKAGMLDPDKLVEGMYDVKTIDALRKRGLGDVFRGPFQAARGGPSPLTKPPKPDYPEKSPMLQPSETPGTGIKEMKNPLSGHPWTLGGGLEGIAAGLGHHMYGMPFMAGAALSNAMPGMIPTRVPSMNPAAQRMLDVLGPMLGMGIAGQATGQSENPNAE
jgi:hypothetical protein